MGTTDWNAIEDQVIDIDAGQTLTVTSSGSDYNEQDQKATIPNMVARNAVANQGMELGAETGILNPTGKRAKEPLKAEHSTHWAISSVVSNAA